MNELIINDDDCFHLMAFFVFKCFVRSSGLLELCCLDVVVFFPI